MNSPVGAAERPHESIEEIEDAAEAAAGRRRGWRQGIEPGAEAVFELGAFVIVRVVAAVHGALQLAQCLKKSALMRSRSRSSGGRSQMATMAPTGQTWRQAVQSMHRTVSM